MEETRQQSRSRPNRFVHEHKSEVAAAIRAKITASGLRPAEFWEQAALRVTIRSIAERPALLAIAGELGKIGGNVYQILRIERFAEASVGNEVLLQILQEIRQVKSWINVALMT